jgi:hypothetical protein
MMRLIQFLGEKSHFLEKFCSLNEKQISLLENGQFDDIERFYNQREDLLKILKYIDAEIFKAHTAHREENASYTDEQKQTIREALRTKEIYVKKIVDQDLIILSLIDEAKTRIIKELQDVQKARKALTGYRSPAA